MDPRSEVVLRQQDYLKGRLLLINAPNDALVSQLPSGVDASVWTWNYADYQGFINTGTPAHFSVEFPSQEFDQALIFVPKSKELLNYILHVVMSHLKADKSEITSGESLNVKYNVSPEIVRMRAALISGNGTSDALSSVEFLNLGDSFF